jgi:alkanesulfonate monooxygenase SsuD/methylene tetrahydromethanopterin reductase-like flavin-dependent oxidoreductase (luciferase family)
MGLGRFVVVANTDTAALALARRAYPKWYQSFTHLHRLHGRSNTHPRPPTFDGLADAGQGVAGAPQTVAEFLRRELAGTGGNYCVGQFAFGDLTLEETLQSIALFAAEVMPELAGRMPVSPV